MRRDRIINSVNALRDALQAAQIRELLRGARNGQQAEGVNRTQKILLAYNVFMRHYQDFSEDEKEMMAFFGLTPLLDLAFWSGLIDSEATVSRKLLSDVDVGAYNVIFVMPKLRELLGSDSDRETLVIVDAAGKEATVKRLRMFVAEAERSLTEPNVVINVLRAMEELYDAASSLRGERGTPLSLGAIDGGAGKAFDFFGAQPVIDDINLLLLNVWDRIKYSTDDTFRYQIEVGMMASGFLARLKEAQGSGRVTEEQGGRATRGAAKAIETLFRTGAYTPEMDAVREVKASEFLVPKTPVAQYRRQELQLEVRAGEGRDAFEQTGERSEQQGPREAKDAAIARDLKDALNGVHASEGSAAY